MGLKKMILNHLIDNYPRVVHKGEICKKAVDEWDYETDNAGRKCRELENEGKIEKVADKKGYAQYQLRGELFDYDYNSQIMAIINRLNARGLNLTDNKYIFRELDQAYNSKMNSTKEEVLKKYNKMF